MKKNVLTLYHFDTCPFCARVRDYLDQEGIDIKRVDILLDDGAREKLVQIGGKSQVPCLVIDNKALYESGDILDWLQEHKDTLHD